MQNFLLALLFLASAAHAGPAPVQQQPECLDESTIDMLFNKFRFYSTNPKVKAEALNFCNPKDPGVPAFAGLTFLKKYSALPRLAAPASNNILGDDALEYMAGRVNAVQFLKDGEIACGESTQGKEAKLSVAAFVMNATPIVYICGITDEFDPLTLAEIFVHESRHVDGYRHSNCERGPLAGAGAACDPSYSTQGSYAVGVEYKLRISKHPALDPALRENARMLAFTDLFQRFNDGTMGMESRLVLADENGQNYQFDGENLEPIAGGMPGQVLTTRSGSNIFFDPATGSAKSFYLSRWSDALGKLARDYRAGLFGVAQRQLLDAAYQRDYACLLFPKELKCFDGSADATDYITVPLQKIRPKALFYSGDSTLVKPGTLFLVSEENELYELPAESKALTQGEASFQLSASPAEYLRVFTLPDMGEGEYAISLQGHLLYTKAGKKGLAPVPGAEAIKFRFLAPTLLLSKYLESL